MAILGSEVHWVQCDGVCEKWFHLLCIGLRKQDIKEEDDYHCKNCSKPNFQIDTNSESSQNSQSEFNRESEQNSQDDTLKSQDDTLKSSENSFSESFQESLHNSQEQLCSESRQIIPNEFFSELSQNSHNKSITHSSLNGSFPILELHGENEVIK